MLAPATGNAHLLTVGCRMGGTSGQLETEDHSRHLHLLLSFGLARFAHRF